MYKTMVESASLNNSCYVILHRDRSTNKDRTRNLLFVIDHIRSEVNIPILVVEQDEKFNNELCQKLLDKKVSYQFLYNPGLFNRSWGYNCSVNLTRYDKLILADNDVVLDNNDLIKGLELLDSYSVVKPFKKLYDLEESDTIQFINTNTNPINLGKKRVNLTAGTLMMITRDAYLTVGGYDERFEGWGGEDDEMTLNLWKYINFKKLTYNEFGTNLLHLYHDRTIFDTFTQPNYDNNYKYITDKQRNQNIIIGQPHKYCIEPKKILTSFIAVHKYWQGLFYLYEDHTFEGGGDRPNGKWSIDSDKQLVLDWNHWGQEKLKSTENGYHNNELQLIFTFLTENHHES